MKVLICLSVVLALANAGHLAHNRVYNSAVYSPGSLVDGLYGNGAIIKTAIPAQVAYVQQQAPAVQAYKQYHTVAAPIAASQIINAQPTIIQHHAPIYGSSPILSSSVVSKPVLAQSYGLATSQIINAQPTIIQHHAPIYGSAPILSSSVVSKPVLAQSYGLAYGSGYGIGGITKIAHGGFLKQ